MATQIKPVSSGSYTTITKTATGGTAKTSTGLAATPSTGHQLLALHGINVWANCGGTGTAAARATKIVKACGLLIQEV
jgi:hypothetical protein